MSQHMVDWLFEKVSFRKSISRTRKRSARPLAAQIELLEDRTLLSTSLGTAESFAVLGGSAVTNTGPSVIDGNLGVGPGTSVTGFPPGIVTNGVIHAADAVALQAQSDLTTAYLDVADNAVTVDLTGQDLGGLTLTPGVYFFSSSAQLTGTLTLDAQGDPNAEFDFQIGSTLTTASGANVVLINGADPCNVFWQVGSSATLGTTTAFVGHILALTSITVQHGATVDGSVLARNGAVTLDDNVISIANCITVSGTGSISGLKYNDANSSQTQDMGELGLPGLTVFLDTNGNGILDLNLGEVSTTTDVNGNYTFANLLPGTYLVREALQPGVTVTTQNPITITLNTGQNVMNVNFGDHLDINFQNITISGTKFNDLNGNHIRDLNEPGLAGVTVFLDTNGNGTLDLGEVSTTTDGGGNYIFANLGPGTYRVREVAPVGWIQTTANPANIVASSGINVVASVPFGNFRLISISGTKFQDTNGSGTQQTGEPGLSGWRIFLDANNNHVLDWTDINHNNVWDAGEGERWTVTNASGNFSFSNVAAGTYRVREVGQTNFVQMTNNPAAIVATSGTNVTTTPFGNMPVANLVTVGKLLLTGNNLSNLLNGTFGLQANFVANLYQTLLGRAPKLAELTDYLRLLMAGYTQQQVTAMFKVKYHV